MIYFSYLLYKILVCFYLFSVLLRYLSAIFKFITCCLCKIFIFYEKIHIHINISLFVINSLVFGNEYCSSFYFFRFQNIFHTNATQSYKNDLGRLEDAFFKRPWSVNVWYGKKISILFSKLKVERVLNQVTKLLTIQILYFPNSFKKMANTAYS